jgi:hypothetical protein
MLFILDNLSLNFYNYFLHICICKHAVVFLLFFVIGGVGLSP